MNKDNLPAKDRAFAIGCFAIAVAALVGLGFYSLSWAIILAVLVGLVFFFNYSELLGEEQVQLLSEKRFYFGASLSIIVFLSSAILFISGENKELGLVFVAFIMPSVALIHSRRPEKYR